jgi:hypothetical protein
MIKTWTPFKKILAVISPGSYFFGEGIDPSGYAHALDNSKFTKCWEGNVRLSEKDEKLGENIN